MGLPGKAESATPAVPGFDCDTTITASLAQQFYAQGYKFCLRYLCRGAESAQDLGEQEARNIVNSGLALMPVQHARNRGWSPNHSIGREDGQNAVENAQIVGFPAGVSVWCDLEGVQSTAQVQDVIEYCKAWYEAVKADSYIPGLYVGAGAQLTGQQLFDLPFRQYWRSQSQVPDIPKRGYQLIQFFPSIEINGVWVDLDVTRDDKEGGVPQWLRVDMGP